jgi:hypothetical protein
MIRRSRACICGEISLASRIAACLSDNANQGRSKAMRKLIKQGLKDDFISADGNFKFREIRTINALLENFRSTGYYDFKFLNKIQDDLIRSISSSADALRLMENLTDLGNFDETIIPQVTTRLLEIAQTQELSVVQVVMLMNVFARQRLRLPELAASLVDEYFPRMSANQKVRVLSNMASLNLPIDPVPDIPAVPMAPSSCVDMILAFVLSPELIRTGNNVDTYLIPALNNLSKAFEGNARLEEFRGPLRRKVLLARSALVNLHPEIHAKLPESSKAFLSFASVSSSNQEPLSHQSDEFTKSVSDVLFKLYIRHNVGVDFGPFSVDIEEAGQKVIWTCDNKNRFYSGADSKMKTSYYSLRDQILRGMGYRVIQIPYWHWSRITERKSRSEYCRMSRHLSLSTRGTLPDEFINTGISDSFHGENFFKKSIPKRSWTWHGHATVPVRISI